MNDNDNQIQIISQVRRCIKSAWKIFVHLRQSSMFPRQRSTEGFQAPDFLGPVEEQELQKTINQQHHIFCHKKKCGNICVERNSNLNFCSFLGVNFLVRFLTWRVFFLDGRLAIRNGRVGKLTDITWRRGCLVCWVPNKKSLVFFYLGRLPKQPCMLSAYRQPSKISLMALMYQDITHGSYVFWITLTWYADLYIPPDSMDLVPQDGRIEFKWQQVAAPPSDISAELGMGSWIFRTGRPQTLERLATACLLTMYVLVNDNGNEREDVCMFCIVLYDTKPAVEYRKQSPAVCACMHGCFYLFPGSENSGSRPDTCWTAMKTWWDWRRTTWAEGLGSRGGSLFFFCALWRKMDLYQIWCTWMYVICTWYIHIYI